MPVAFTIFPLLPKLPTESTVNVAFAPPPEIVKVVEAAYPVPRLLTVIPVTSPAAAIISTVQSLLPPPVVATPV